MSKEPYNLHFSFRIYWVINWIILITGSIIALVDISKKSCGEHIPILLSRALTSDPYRGGTLILCLTASISSIYLNSVLLSISFFGFFSAFLISMFNTAPSHDMLILIGSIIVMWECWPRKKLLWYIHWCATVLSGAVFLGFYFYTVFVCDYDDWPEQTLPMPDSVRCSRCSWWFISEYLAFWLMFMLVYWKIDPSLQWRDHYLPVKTSENPPSNKKKKQLDF